MVTVLINYQFSVAFLKGPFLGHSLLLYINHINDLPNSVPRAFPADDTNFFISESTISELDLNANLQILNKNKWLIANILHFLRKMCEHHSNENFRPTVKANSSKVKNRLFTMSV